MTRCFSISSAASGPGEEFTLTVRAHDEGQVSKLLVDARPGQLLHLSQAQGDFTLQVSPATPGINRLLFITGGSGITPAMSIVRTLLRDGYDGSAGRKVTFLHYARSEADQIFADELAEIAAADNHVDVHLRYGDADVQRVRAAPPRARLPRHRHLGLRPGRADRPGARGVRRQRPAAAGVLQAAAHASTRRGRGRVTFTGADRRSPTPAPPCSSRPRRWA